MPLDYSRIKHVRSFDELATTRFTAGINALCWERTLPGDFGEVVAKLGKLDEGITALTGDRLRALPVSAAGRIAIDLMLEDLRLLQAQGRDPVLNCITAYPREEAPGIVPIDVYSYHADSAPVEADTWLCTYHGAPSEGLRNEDAIRRVDDPATRAKLLHAFGGEDNAAFHEHLNEHCYDLHYAPLPGAKPYSFGVGNLWRITIDWPGSPVPPCIHRAPDNLPGDPARLLLIS